MQEPQNRTRLQRAALWGLPPWAARLAAFALAFALWQAASEAGLISSFLLPAPLDIARSFVGLVEDDNIALAFLRTALETLGAFVCGGGLGLSVGWSLHRFPRSGRAYTDWIGALAASPLVLLYPVFLVVIGRNEGTIVAMGALVAAPSVALKTKEGLDGVRPVLLAVGRTLKLGPWAMFRLIQLPAALPTIFTGLRLGLVFALINTVGVEFLLGFDGLGLLISDLGDRFDLGGMYAAIVFVLVISALFLYVTERAEAWLLSTR
jgi:NitT/TauT family transport system permease protein